MDEKLRKRGGCCRDATFPWPWWGNYMPAVELGTLAPGQDEWLDCIPVGHNAPVADGAENDANCHFLSCVFAKIGSGQTQWKSKNTVLTRKVYELMARKRPPSNRGMLSTARIRM